MAGISSDLEKEIGLVVDERRLVVPRGWTGTSWCARVVVAASLVEVVAACSSGVV